MKKILLYILAFFLIPFYPLLKRMQRRMGEKIKISEKVIVVTMNQNGIKKTMIN
jgi:uncharacterized protein YneF (UPF0154 family)